MWGRGASASPALRPGGSQFPERKVTEAVQRETQRPRRGRRPPSLGGALGSPAPRSRPVRGAPPASAPPPGSPWKPAVPREEPEEESAECPRCARGPRAQPAARCCPEALRPDPGLGPREPRAGLGGVPGAGRDGRRPGALPGRQALPWLQLPGLGGPERVGFPQQCGKKGVSSSTTQLDTPVRGTPGPQETGGLGQERACGRSERGLRGGHVLGAPRSGDPGPRHLPAARSFHRRAAPGRSPCARRLSLRGEPRNCARRTPVLPSTRVFEPNPHPPRRSGTRWGAKWRRPFLRPL